jgi:hypothetical protein
MRSDDLLLELDQLIANAKPIPLTDQVRVKPEQIRELLQELRDALAAERR